MNVERHKKLFSLLENVRKRAGMFLGPEAVQGHPDYSPQKAVRLLEVFIIGHDAAVGEYEGVGAMFLRPFFDFLERTYGTSCLTAAGRANQVAEKTGGDSWDIWWKFFDRYKESLEESG